MEALWLEPASNFLLRLNAFGVHDFDDRRFGIIKKRLNKSQCKMHIICIIVLPY